MERFNSAAFFSNNNTNDYIYTADTKILDFLGTSCVIN